MLKKIFIVIVLLLIISSAGYILVKAYPDFKAQLDKCREEVFKDIQKDYADLQKKLADIQAKKPK